jgi:hypothetical protein
MDWGPDPSAARLGPRTFSTGVVDSLGEGFVGGCTSTQAPISS